MIISRKSILSVVLLLCSIVISTHTNAETYTLTGNDVTVVGGVITICTADLSGKEVIIPSSIGGQTITGIGHGIVPAYEGADYFYEKGAFEGKYLTKVIFPSTLREIGSTAFEYCGQLTDIDWSQCDNLKKIGRGAFSYCNLSSVDFTLLPKLEKIDNDAFVDNDISEVNLNKCQNLRSLVHPFSNNPLVSVVMDSCSSLKSFCIATQEKEGWGDYDHYAITSIKLPAIADDNYQAWQTTSDWVTPDTLIAALATSPYCFATYYLPVSHTLTDDDVVVKDGYIIKYTREEYSPILEIPEYLDGQQVVGISIPEAIWWVESDDQFNGKFITHITLPLSLKYIGEGTFCEMSDLQVNLDELVNLEYIGEGAFDLENMDTLSFASGKIVENGIYCNDINYVDINGWANVRTFISHQFHDCYFGDTLDLSNFKNLENIEEYVFYNTTITHVNVSGCTSLKQIEYYAFDRESPTYDFTGCTAMVSFVGYEHGSSDINVPLPTPSIDGLAFGGWMDSEGNKNLTAATKSNVDYFATFSSPYIMASGDDGNFGRFYPGNPSYEQPCRRIYIWNNSSVEINITDIQLPTDFTFVNNDRGDDDQTNFTIQPGKDVELKVYLNPTHYGEYSGELVLVCNEAVGDKRIPLYANVIDVEALTQTPDAIVGCMDAGASNYSVDANTAGTCIYDITGCTDSVALNYNAEATVDNGNCIYTQVVGCMQPEATNYNSEATIEDGSCTFASYTYGCTDAKATNYDATANIDNDYCVYNTTILGCTDATALNYNADATRENGSCVFDQSIAYGCTDSMALNYNPDADYDNGNCIFNVVNDEIAGCTYPQASNYNILATLDNGSCEFAQGEAVKGCIYPQAINYNPAAHADDGSCYFAKSINIVLDTVSFATQGIEIIGTTPQAACEYDFTTPIDSVVVSDLVFIGDSLQVQWNIYQGDGIAHYIAMYSNSESQDVQLYFSLVCNSSLLKSVGSEKVKAITISSIINIEATADIDNAKFYGNVEAFFLYPIPTKDVLNIAFNSHADGAYETIIYDMQGRAVAAQNIFLSNELNSSVDVSFLNQGSYIVRISKGNALVGTAKFTK